MLCYNNWLWLKKQIRFQLVNAYLFVSKVEIVNQLFSNGFCWLKFKLYSMVKCYIG